MELKVSLAFWKISHYVILTIYLYNHYDPWGRCLSMMKSKNAKKKKIQKIIEELKTAWEWGCNRDGNVKCTVIFLVINITQTSIVSPRPSCGVHYWNTGGGAEYREVLGLGVGRSPPPLPPLPPLPRLSPPHMRVKTLGAEGRRIICRVWFGGEEKMTIHTAQLGDAFHCVFLFFVR